ncbi:protein-tyrosine kinase, partial [Candidatus Thiomargarita nelsonii]
FKEIEAGALGKVAELSKRYGAQHPTMIAAKAELKAAQDNTIKQINQVIDSFSKEYQVANANVAALQKRMKQLEKQVQDITQKEYQLRVLQRDVETNRQLYDMFLARFKETDVSQTQQSSVGRVVDPAVVPIYPTKPRKKLLIALALMVGFVLSVMLAFLLDYLDNTLKGGEDVEQKLGLPLLGILPKVKVSKKEKFKLAHLLLREGKSQFAEAIRTIRTGIMLSKVDNPHKVLLVTSSVPYEGKTTFAINQAFALGQMNKVLLIDADMRHPTVGRAFGLTQESPGLSELITGTKEMSDCIHTMEEAAIDLIPSGAALPPNPLELLASQHFKDILTKLEQSYEYIVIDSTP